MLRHFFPDIFFNYSSDYTESIISKRLQDPASKGGFPLWRNYYLRTRKKEAMETNDLNC